MRAGAAMCDQTNGIESRTLMGGGGGGVTMLEKHWQTELEA